MRIVVKAILVAVALCAPASADVVMPPPPLHSDISLQLQQEVTRRHGGEMNRSVHRALGAIVVAGDYGRSGTGGAYNLLIRDQLGWSSYRTNRPRRIAAPAGAEIDRILGGDDFWREDGFVYGQPCPGSGRRMQVIHRGRDKTTRQMCAPAGLTGRLAALAATERVPSGRAPAVGGKQEAMRGARGSDHESKRPLPADVDAAELVMFLKGRSTYSLRDGDLPGYLAAFAPDVTMVWPGRAERGIEALRRRASGPNWSGLDKRHVTPGEGYLTQLAPDRFRLEGTYAYWDGTRELRIPFVADWRKRGPRWVIVREEIATPRPAA